MNENSELKDAIRRFVGQIEMLLQKVKEVSQERSNIKKSVTSEFIVG